MYRFWRDLSHALSVVLAGLLAHAAGLSGTVIPGGDSLLRAGGRPAENRPRQEGQPMQPQPVSAQTLAAWGLGEADPASGGVGGLPGPCPAPPSVAGGVRPVLSGR